MTINDILPNTKLSKDLRKITVSGIADDSRLVKNGEIFFVIERNNFDIFSIVLDIKDKVSAFVVDERHRGKFTSLIKHKPLIYVRDVAAFFRIAVDRFYEFNRGNIKCIAVTGTNGKTTTVSLIKHILSNLGKKTCLIGTVHYAILDSIYKATHTTPDYLSLRKIFKAASDRGVKYMVIEASSHGIEQSRIGGINFLRCVFTNLTRDHLDYHKTMSNYFNAKRKLFSDNPRSLAIINSDDSYGRKLIQETKRHLTYGIKRKASCMAENIKLFTHGAEFDILYKGKRYHAATSLLGKHNILNILAAVLTVKSLGFSFASILGSVRSFKGAEGRLERVTDNIFVDYAHTPDALGKVLRTLKEIGYKRIICVFGCGGNRDKGKRKLMGSIASVYADFTIITSDNPRWENAFTICHEIEYGFKKKNYVIIVDRKKAIKEAIRRYKTDTLSNQSLTCVLVAGKGHEDYQSIKDKKFPFKDSQVINNLVS